MYICLQMMLIFEKRKKVCTQKYVRIELKVHYNQIGERLSSAEKRICICKTECLICINIFILEMFAPVFETLMHQNSYLNMIFFRFEHAPFLHPSNSELNICDVLFEFFKSETDKSFFITDVIVHIFSKSFIFM